MRGSLTKLTVFPLLLFPGLFINPRTLISGALLTLT